MPVLNQSDNSVNVNVRSTNDGSGVRDAQKDLKDLGDTGKDTESKLKSFSEKYNDGLKKIAGVTAVVGAGLAVYAKSSTDYLTQLVGESKELGRVTGMSAEDSSRLIAAMRRVGLDASTAGGSFRILARNITESQGSSKQYALQQEEIANKIEATKIKISDLNQEIKKHDYATEADKNQLNALNIQLEKYRQELNSSGSALDRLGVSTKDSTGKNRDFYNILLDVADKFKDMPDGAQKTSLAMDLFGRSGTSMIKVLNQGSEGLEKLAEDAEKYGLTLTEGNIGAVSEYIKSQKDLAMTNDSLRIQIATLTIPAMTWWNQTLNDVATALVGTDGPLRDVVAGAVAFGPPILGAVSGLAAFAGNIASALPLLASLRTAISTPMVMPAIAVAAAIGALGLVIAKTQETMDVVADAGNAIENARQSGEKTDAAVRKMAKEGKISTEALNTYLRNTQKAAESTKSNLYTGFFGPLERSLDNLFVRLQGREEQFKGTGFGGFASGGFTGRGGVNEVAGVVHRGEYVLRQDQVDQSTGLPKTGAIQGAGASGGGTVISVQNLNLNTGEAVRAFMTYDDLDEDTRRTLLGLSPARGL